MVEVKRFELWTFRTSSERSNQLSYTSVPRDEPQPTAPTMVIVSCFFSKSNIFFQKKEKYFCSFCKKRTEDYKQPKNSRRNCTKKGTTLVVPFSPGLLCYISSAYEQRYIHHSNGSRDNHLHCAVQKTPFRLHPGFARKHSRRILRHSQRIHNYRTM